MTGQLGVQVGPVLVLGADAAPAVVDRVPAAPQDALVLGEPVVVEHVAGVRQRLPARPADRVELLRAQRLRHQRVVVHRHHVQPEPAEQRTERVGREHGAPCAHRAPRRAQLHAVAGALERGDGRALVDAHAPLLAGARQPPRQARGVEDGRVVVPEAGEIRGRVDLGAQLLAVQPGTRDARAFVLLARLAQALDLPRGAGDLHLPRPLPAAVDGQVADGRLDGREVLVTELDEPRVLRGEELLPLADPVRERRHADAAVAAARLPAGGAGLEHDDVGRRVLLLGEERRPEAGEAGADHGEVAGLGAGERRPRGRRRRAVEPVGYRLGLAQRLQPGRRRSFVCGSSVHVDHPPRWSVVCRDGQTPSGGMAGPTAQPVQPRGLLHDSWMSCQGLMPEPRSAARAASNARHR